jgi:hypothetical protein
MAVSNSVNENNNSVIYKTENSKPIIVAKDSILQLSESPPSSSIDIVDTVNKKDDRLELVEISKGLIEMLQNAGFTIETILDNGPSHIAETLGIDVYIGEIIYKETKKKSI